MSGDPSCTKCGGLGKIRKDDLTSIRCPCNVRIQINTILGPDFMSVPPIEGALYQNGPKWGEPTLDRTQENLFILGRWTTVLGHLRWALSCKLRETDLRFRHLVITDEKIKNVYVGNEHFRSKTREEGERETSYNGLSDIMCEHDLVILRLGFLGHRNRAAGGGIWEALMLREVDRKPTWIVDNFDRPYNSDNLSFNPETASYIDRHFKVVDFREEDKQAPPPIPSALPPAASEEEEMARPSVEDEGDFILNDPVVMGSGAPKRFKPKKRTRTGPV